MLYNPEILKFGEPYVEKTDSILENTISQIIFVNSNNLKWIVPSGVIWANHTNVTFTYTCS